ncbi:glycosyltransferase [Fluviicola chungangensis]|uniref:Glycosyltransferase n=1 Tax=Fluviicola chungangensis TaxID=2597671 RepID=A0A556N6Q2_9FLAO|nr:glycosyltransferase [Fluviicola chungangensis]TSJ47709.1 glycosyltransferase [Fluviicola chungangensis]
MRILYIAPKSPAPVIDGGCFAMMECLKGLSQIATVDGIIFATHKHPYTKESERVLSQYLESQTVVPINTEIKATGALVNFLRRKNYNLSRFKSGKLYRELETKLREQYDYIVCDSLFAAAQLSQFDFTKLAPVIIRSHNIESEIWKLQASLETAVLKRFYLRNLEKTLRREETEILNKASTVWAISNEDQEWIAKHTRQKNTVLLPVSVSLSPEIQVDYSNKGFFHLGSMDWKPNQEAVNYLVKTIWSNPKISGLPLKIAGSKSEHFRFLGTDSIEVVGWVKDSNAFMAQSGTLVTPILSGSGIRIKLLEAMALGIPCITTKLGAAGIDVSQSGIQIADSADTFVKLILEFHENDRLRQEAGNKSRDYISKVHSFDTCIALMKHTLGV